MAHLPSPRVAGLAMTLGVLLPLLATAGVASRGNINGLEAGFRGVEGIGSSARSLAIVTAWGIPGTILQIVGLGLLALTLREAGAPIAVLAFALAALGLTLALVEGTFQASVTVWAGEQYDRTGVVPDLFEPLRHWLNVWLQRVWVPMTATGLIGAGWAIVASGVAPEWTGWVLIGICSALLVQLVFQGAIVVAFLFLPELLLGLVLVIRG